MSRLFISHSSQDDGFVGVLRTALADHGHDGWIDSREMRGGDPLESEIFKAIGDANGYAVVVSPDGLQSKWVGKELRQPVIGGYFCDGSFQNLHQVLNRLVA
jgi:hypothetical protein